MAKAPTVHSTKMIGMMIVRGHAQHLQQRPHQEQAEEQDADAWPASSSRPRRRRTAACLIISIGPGWTPWMIIAAISTADGAEPGIASASAGMMPPGIAGVVAGLGRHQALDRALAELLLLLAGALGRGIGRPGRHVLADAGQDADVRRRSRPSAGSVRQYWNTSRMRGSTESTLLIFTGLRSARLHRRQDLGEAERADQRRDQRDAAGQLVVAEGEAVVGVDAVLADLRDEQAERSPSASP